MKSKVKRWAGLGLSTAFLGTGLAACGSGVEDGAVADTTTQAEAADVVEEANAATPETEPASGDIAAAGAGDAMGEGGEGEGGEGEGGEAGANMDTLPLPKRLAFMSGHVEAGLALYRAGAPEMAAQHLMHPVSETHASERAGLDALGFDAALFEDVSKALEDGVEASEIEPQLVAAEAHLSDLASRAGGEDADIIRFLMDVVAEEYAIAITDDKVSDPGEYQDAYGFAIVARKRAEAIENAPEGLVQEIDKLIALWPEAPIPDDAPTPVGQVLGQASRVALTLPSQ